MSKCVYCHERKGKRPCPALGGAICSQCCGEHRQIRISCPEDCEYLDANSVYQQKRAGDRFAHERRDFYKSLFDFGGEPAAALFNLIEVATYGYFRARHDGLDGDILAGIQALRRTLSPLHIPAAPPPAFAERLKTEYEAFAAHQREQGRAALDQELATEVLDRALAFVTTISGGSLHSRRFLTSIIGYINSYHPDVAEHVVKQDQDGGRIILPGQLPTGQIPVPPARLHAHPHDHPHHRH